MSDHTSDTQNGLGAEAGEPSMEDILASIRRIIAEDDVSDSGKADLHVDLAAPAITGATETSAEDVLDLDNDDQFDEVLDLSDILADSSDIEIPETAAEVTEGFNPVSSVVSDLEDMLASENADVSEDQTAANELDLILSDMDLLSSEDEDGTETNEEAFNLLKDDVLSVLEDDVVDDFEDITLSEDLVIDEEELILEDYVEIDEPLVSGASESDLDLVKSLMADLTDTSFLETDAVTANTDIEDLTVIEEPVSDFDVFEEVEAAAITEDYPDQDQILNDILDMNLEGQEQQNTLEALELSVQAEEVIPEATFEEAEISIEEDNLLLQIASAVEADALAEDSDVTDELMELEVENDLTDTFIEETLLEVEEDMSFSVEEAESIEEITELEEAESADLFIEAPQETEEMPKSARKDTILDEVTETAAAGAFASLNQVVEDKAVFTESGPRIGDLVQDALRPMLKEWLDANLKGIVERAVAKEVKRISSGK